MLDATIQRSYKRIEPNHKGTKPQGSIRTNELAYLIIPQSRPEPHILTTHISVRILVCRPGLTASFIRLAAVKSLISLHTFVSF